MPHRAASAPARRHGSQDYVARRVPGPAPAWVEPSFDSDSEDDSDFSLDLPDVDEGEFRNAVNLRGRQVPGVDDDDWEGDLDTIIPVLPVPANGVFRDDLSSDSDDSDILVLDEAPEHLRPVRHGSPIEIVDMSDDDEDEAPRPSQPAKRRISDGIEILTSPPTKRQQVAPRASDMSLQAGPSNETIVTKVNHLLPLVLDVIPDLCVDWARAKLERIIDTLKDKTVAPGQEAIDHVLNAAFEMESYPRAGGPAKPAEEEPAKEKVDYKLHAFRSQARAGPAYNSLSMSILETLLTTIPVSYIKEAWLAHGQQQLVPTYVYLHGLASVAEKPYKVMKKPRNGKGKSRVMERPVENDDEDDGVGEVEFYREYRYLKTLISEAAEVEEREMVAAASKAEQDTANVKRREAAIAEGRGEECGCCFDTEPLEDMVACGEGHMFCRSCVASFAESKLGEQQTDITCMDTSGCQAVFSQRVLADVVGEKTMSLYHRLRQMKDLELACIDGLESCPHCPFAIVIDNTEEKLFRCLNPACLKVTCRNCKRADHIPKRCEEVEEAFKLDKRHTIEEAMSAALMRRCPKCAKPYLKESGCNKITCINCRTVSCYICQKEIPEDYGHFDQFPGRRGKDSTKCQLWDRGNEGAVEAERIRVARDEARAKVLEAAAVGGVQLDDADINIEVPAPAPAPAGPAGAHAGFHARLAALDHRLPLFAYVQHARQDEVAALGAEGRAAVDEDRQRRAAQALLRAHGARRAAEAGHQRHLGNEILGFGRMLQDHQAVMDEQRLQIAARGQRIVDHMREIAGPAPAPLGVPPLGGPPGPPYGAGFDQLMRLRQQIGPALAPGVNGIPSPLYGANPIFAGVQPVLPGRAALNDPLQAAQARALQIQAQRLAAAGLGAGEAQAVQRRAAEVEEVRRLAEVARRQAEVARRQPEVGRAQGRESQGLRERLGQAAPQAQVRPPPVAGPAPPAVPRPRRGAEPVDELALLGNIPRGLLNPPPLFDSDDDEELARPHHRRAPMQPRARRFRDEPAPQNPNAAGPARPLGVQFLNDAEPHDDEPIFPARRRRPHRHPFPAPVDAADVAFIDALRRHGMRRGAGA